MPDPKRLPVDDAAAGMRPRLIAASPRVSYCIAAQVADEDLKQFIQEPIASLPPSVVDALPKLELMLVPYLEKANGRGAVVSQEKPEEAKRLWFSRAKSPRDTQTLIFAVAGEDLADHHYTFYTAIAELLADLDGPAFVQYTGNLREELAAKVHGEVEDKSWQLKQTLTRRPGILKKEGKPFQQYARQSYVDTLTLYLHGICCDIDVESGPRKIPSRHLRKRLEMLCGLWPPPEGYAVLPEQIKKRV